MGEYYTVIEVETSGKSAIKADEMVLDRRTVRTTLDFETGGLRHGQSIYNALLKHCWLAKIPIFPT